MPPLRPGDAVTAAEFARERHLDRSIVNRWRERGYLDQDGNRIYIKPRGKIQRGSRTYPVYLVSELAAAELATRPRAKERRDPILACSQRQMRARRAERREAAA